MPGPGTARPRDRATACRARGDAPKDHLGACRTWQAWICLVRACDSVSLQCGGGHSDWKTSVFPLSLELPCLSQTPPNRCSMCSRCLFLRTVGCSPRQPSQKRSDPFPGLHVMREAHHVRGRPRCFGALRVATGRPEKTKSDMELRTECHLKTCGVALQLTKCWETIPHFAWDHEL